GLMGLSSSRRRTFSPPRSPRLSRGRVAVLLPPAGPAVFWSSTFAMPCASSCIVLPSAQDDSEHRRRVDRLPERILRGPAPRGCAASLSARLLLYERRLI